MKRSLRARSAAALLVVGALALTACSSPAPEPAASSSDDASTGNWASIEKAADAEGQVTWYVSSQNAVNIPVVAAFNKKYPNIQVQITRLISGELTTRYSSEKEAGAPSADVVQISDDVMLSAHPDWFAKISKENMPNLSVVPEKDFKKLVQSRYVAIQASPFTVTTNTNLVKKDPKTWEDLIKSPWAGKGSLADPRSAASFMALYGMLRAEYGDDYLKKLGASGNPFYKATATQAPLVAAGATGYLTPTVGDNTKALRDAKAPLKVVTVTPVLALTANVAVNSKAAHPNAAKVFSNFLLSRQAAAESCSEESQSFFYSDVPGCVLAPAGLAIVDYAQGTKQSAEIIKLLGLS